MPAADPAILSLLPMMSLADPEKSAEGGLDPLGLYSIADELALRLCPGVRERQKRPRYLTMQAVSLALCAEFARNPPPTGHRTEPWLVFEWHVVEGLVRHSDGDPLSLPGSKKVKQAVERGLPLSPQNYLKTPAAFGFHGVYRLLARHLGIEESEVLGSAGHELLCLWEKDQGLGGFTSSYAGPGHDLRRQWQDAVHDGLKHNRTSRGGGWSGWTTLNQHLHPEKVGREESRWLKNRLLHDTTGHRGELMRFYRSGEGRKAASSGLEHAAHKLLLLTTGSKPLKILLAAIAAYEQVARLAQNAFEACLCEMTHAHGAVDVSCLGSLAAVQKAGREIPARFSRTLEALERESPDLALRFQQSFAALGIPGSSADWAARLLNHHVGNQNRKPPHGKRPWVEGEGARWRVRPLYGREAMPVDDGRYVHAYRMGSLRQFLMDLKVSN